MADELEEISGIKPKVWLPDGEEREVAYKSRYGPDLFPFNDDDFAGVRCRSRPGDNRRQGSSHYSLSSILNHETDTVFIL